MTDATQSKTEKEWFETETPKDLTGPVEVICGDGVVRIVDATEIRNEYRHLTWVAWSRIEWV